MYEHFEPSDRVFVDREEYLEWMDEALKRCKEKAVVMHLRGIGGIGKSSLLEKWSSTINETVRLDCDQHLDFWDRLEVITRGVVRLGVSLRRFDILWHIRKRFVEGVEPATEKGREWAKEVLVAIPFIGSIASIGSALSAIGKKVAPRLREKYGDIGTWLQTHLGKDYIGRLLEILWKEPRRAEFLYLDALLEDLNERKTSEKPILFLFDHFEDVDAEKTRWRYEGKKIAEAELWFVFLSSLKNCVGVLASRFDAPKSVGDEVEKEELIELDRESCTELLELQNVDSKELQDQIISVSGGNPFVIDAICDIIETGKLSLDDLENLRAGTLEEVRLKTWRRLFSRAEGLNDFISRAGLLPFFNRRLLGIIAPSLTTDGWNRIIRLSFVRMRDDETFVLHDLAKSLVITELGDRLSGIVEEVVGHLRKAHEVESDYSLLGHAISALFLADEDDAITRVYEESNLLAYQMRVSEFPVLLGSMRLDSTKGQAVLHQMWGFAHMEMDRIAEAEHEFKESEKLAYGLADENMAENGGYLMHPLYGLGQLYISTRRHREAENVLTEGLQISEELDGTSPVLPLQEIVWVTRWAWGRLMMSQYRLHEAEESLRIAVEGANHFMQVIEDDPSSREEIRQLKRGYVELAKNSLALTLFMLGDSREAEKMFREILSSDSTVSTAGSARNQLAEVLRLTSRPSEAEENYRQLLENIREVMKNNPDVPWPITMWLVNHASSLVLMNEFEKAEESYREGLEVIRRFADETPEFYEPLLVLTLSDYAVFQRRRGEYTGAEDCASEALELSRGIVSNSPEISNYKTGIVLNNVGVIFRHLGRYDDAEASFLELIELVREDVAKHPEAVMILDLFSSSLNNIGVLMRKSNRLDEAEEYLRQSFDIKKKLAETSPDMFRYGVSIVLNNLGVLLAEAGRPDESEECFREAINTRRELVKETPELYRTPLASCLNNLGVLLGRTGKPSEAWRAFQQALDNVEEFYNKAPRVYGYLLRVILTNMMSLASENEKWMAESKSIAERLTELGIEGGAESDVWSEEEQEIVNPVGPP